MLLPLIKRNLKSDPQTAEEQRQEQPEIETVGTGNREQGAGTEGKKQQAEKPAAPAQPEKNPQPEKPAAPAQPSTPPAPVSTPPVKPAETRDRSIYLIQKQRKANDDVSLVLVKVNRNLNANMLTDSINALLAGPTPDEIMREIESCVPEGSRLLSARVDDSTGTAHLSFNQEFRHNQHGREGCEALIKQIVWTATEFPNVKDVQFLIEGQRVDFLSEGVVIRNPIGR